MKKKLIALLLATLMLLTLCACGAKEAPAAAPAEIEARMRIMENVLRYLIIRKDA